MAKTGILIHVYHLEAVNWQELAWGIPQEDRLGSVTKFVDVLLDIPAEDEVTSLIYNGPSIKDGLGEGGYTKRFLLDRLAQLGDFETLKQKLEALDHRARETFEKRVQDLSVEASIKNTYEEITHAAAVFGQNPAPQKVLQIASAGHAPRCMHNQVIARRDGFIKKGQPWYVVATDTTFPGSQLEDVLIIEPPSRGDDPLVGFSPTLGSTLKSFFGLSGDAKKRVISAIATTMDEAKQSDLSN